MLLCVYLNLAVVDVAGLPLPTLHAEAILHDLMLCFDSFYRGHHGHRKKLDALAVGRASIYNLITRLEDDCITLALGLGLQ